MELVDTADDLAMKLAAGGLPLCTGFAVAAHSRYVFLNDSSVGNPNHFLVVKKPRAADHAFRILDGVNFDGLSHEESVAYIAKTFAGPDDYPIFRVGKTRLERPDQHHNCPYCS